MDNPRAKIVTFPGYLLNNTKTFFSDTRYISDSLGSEIYKGTAHVPIFINAQTGAGKNYLLRNNLLKYAMENKFRILYISNRSALSGQEKLNMCRAIKALDKKLGEKLKWEMDKYKPSRLEDFWDLGPVIIRSYQGIFTLSKDLNKNNILKDNILFVVFDECHFFTADAAFNSQTNDILQYVIKYFPYAVRMYLSATPDDVLVPILEKEYNAQKEMLNLLPDERFSMRSDYGSDISRRFWPVELKVSPPPYGKYYGDVIHTPIGHTYNNYTAVIYNFKKDYSYLNMRFISEGSPLNYVTKCIQKEIADENSDKWLLFIRNKKTGKKLVQKLGSKNAIFIYAKDKSTDAYQKLITKEKFDHKVLIATSVINNGVNISDPAVKNIFVEHFDKTECIQMVGRVRIPHGDNEPVNKINLYLPIHSSAYLARQLKNNTELLDILYDFDKMNEIERFNFANRLHGQGEGKHFYTLVTGKAVYNPMYKAFLQQKNSFLSGLLARINSDTDTPQQTDFNEFILAQKAVNLHSTAAAKGKDAVAFSDGSATIDTAITALLTDYNSTKEGFTNHTYGKNAILAEYLSWFGKADQNPEALLVGNEVEQSAKDALIALLESHAVEVESDIVNVKTERNSFLQNGLNTIKQDAFREEMTMLIKSAYLDSPSPRGKEATYAITALNNTFTERGIAYKIFSDQIDYWQAELQANPDLPKQETLWLVSKKTAVAAGS